MPLIGIIEKKHILKIAIWKINEDPKKIFLKYPISIKNKIIYENRSIKRKKEFLAIYCAFHSLGEDLNIYYNNKGKPFSKKISYISISHSGKIGIVALSKIDIGIDIEKENKKILYVSKKFLHYTESAFIKKKIK